jgi:hypothetical protein
MAALLRRQPLYSLRVRDIRAILCRHTVDRVDHVSPIRPDLKSPPPLRWVADRKSRPSSPFFGGLAGRWSFVDFLVEAAAEGRLATSISAR